MKRFITAFFCIMPLLIVGHAGAQISTVSDPVLRKKLEEYSKKTAIENKKKADAARTLNLSSNQVQSIKKIRNQYSSQMRPIIQKFPPSLRQYAKDLQTKAITQEQYRTKSRQLVLKMSEHILPLQKKRDQSIDQLLTSAQRQKIQELRKTHRGFSLATVVLP